MPDPEPNPRADFKRMLGFTLGRVRTRLTNYSQESIAEELGRDVETIGRWERGTRGDVKAYDLHVLATKYDVPAEWLLFPTDSVIELDRRIERLRAERLARAALEAAQGEEEGPHRQDDDDAGDQRGRRSA